MNAALAHQQQGEFGEADRLYSAALALDSDNFDALHMQGVVAYQRREYHRAEALIRRAIEINPQVETAHHNLNLVLNAHALESELCGAMLPALAAWCEKDAPASNDRAHLVTFEGTENESMRLYRVAIEQAFAAEPWVSIWRQQKDGALLATHANAAEALPRAGTFVFVGTRAAPGPWYRGTSPGHPVIVCHEAALCEVYDQIRAVTHELARSVHLWFASDAAAREVGLPGGRGDAAAMAAWLHEGRAQKLLHA
jgi:tetratricopeptide (TPR) repeat protein